MAIVSDPLGDLTRDGLHVWRILLSQSGEVVRKLEGHLSVDEVQRADRYRSERDRTQYVVAHGALREVLSDYTSQTPRDISFGRTTTGKPFLLDTQGAECVRFNLSHSGEWAIIALALSTEVGIDIEQIDSDISVEAVAERFFSHSELAALREVPPRQRTFAFFTAWARKEAYVKARGEGISNRLSGFSISIDPEKNAVLLADSMDEYATLHWRIYPLDIAHGYAAAIATEGAMDRLRTMSWKPHCP